MFSDTMIDDLVAEGSIIGYALELDLPGDVVRVHTGVGELLIDGDTYLGMGELGGVGSIESVGDDKPAQLTASLSGVPGRLMTAAFQAQSRGAAATLYVLVFNEDGQLRRVEAGFIGIIVGYRVQSGESNVISITMADEFETYEQPWYRFWTDESHQQEQSGDRICRYGSQMGEREINWGAKRDAPPFKYT